MSLAILAASTAPLRRVPPSGNAPAAAEYPHLKCVAGVASSAPSAALRQATGYERVPRTARGPLRLGAEIERHAVALLQQPGAGTLPVVDVLHCQATLPEQILESISLRVAHAVSAAPRRALTIDQTGTIGVANALALGLQAPVAGSDGLLLITAADAWSNVFPGDFAPLVNYGNAVGALLLRQAKPAGAAIGDRAQVLAVRCHPAIANEPFWNRAPELIRHQLGQSLVHMAEEVLEQVGWGAHALDLLLGEPFGQGLATAVACRLGVRDGVIVEPAREHAGSAALMGNVVTAIEHADARGIPLKCLLWTASADGGVAAVALHALPRTVAEN